MNFISNLSNCPKNIDKLIFYYAITPHYGQTPTFCYAKVVAVRNVENSKPVETILLNTVFTLFDHTPILFLAEMTAKFKAAMKTLPVPNDCYEVYISNPFYWALLSGLAKEPIHNHLRVYFSELEKISKKKWKFYFEKNGIMKDTGDWVFLKYRAEKKYHNTGISNPKNFKIKFEKELESRKKFNYVRQ